MGFIDASEKENMMEYSNFYLGNGSLRDCSLGIVIGNNGYKYFLFHGIHYNNITEKYKSNENFKDDDEFCMSFNFIKNELNIFHNGCKTETLSLNNYENIIPALTLHEIGDRLEITKWQFRS